MARGEKEETLTPPAGVSQRTTRDASEGDGPGEAGDEGAVPAGVVEGVRDLTRLLREALQVDALTVRIRPK